jgi:hypothetical protein
MRGRRLESAPPLLRIWQLNGENMVPGAQTPGDKRIASRWTIGAHGPG